ncbi:MAG: hypothetical protein Q7V57_08615 [Actinomycetota bacterium]|nr:hypothetical protein [Actinomycetota bacterium]
MSLVFWRDAWAVVETLQAGPDTPSDAREMAVGLLRDDLLIQRYAFGFRRVSDPRWLPIFRQAGLFTSPPPVVTVEGGGRRASGWPILAYLREVGSSRPEECTEILSAISTNNWWVVAEALAIAVEIDDDSAIAPLLSLLRQWEKMEMQWTQPEVLSRALDRLASQQEGHSFVEGMFRIARRFIDDRSNHYELREVIPGIASRLEPHPVRGIADAVEEVFLSKAITSDWRPYLRSLDDTSSFEDPVELLVREWLTAIARELEAYGGFAAFRRAVRLLAAPSPLLRQMGLRALSAALAVAPTEPQALSLLAHLAHGESLTTTYEELPEFTRLFRERFELLDRPTQSKLLQRLVEQASSTEVLDRYYARDWLHALRAHLAARELLILEGLSSELGVPQDSFARLHASAGWVGPKSPVASMELASMPVPDLLGILSHVPIQVDNEWPYEGGSPEGLGRALQSLMRDRISDFWPHLGAFAEAAESAELLFYIAWGLRDVFSGAEERQPERLDSLIDFISIAARRAQSGELRPATTSWPGNQVGRGLADLMESVGDWLVRSPRCEQILDVLSWLLDSDDPSLVETQDDAWDPPSRAINSVRGEAVLAALKIRAQYWVPEDDLQRPILDGVSELLRLNVQGESSDAVLSSYGRYLPSLITYWREFFDESEAALLPTADSATQRWSSVFVTYLAFYGPHRRTAQELRGHYELAISRLPSLANSYLGKHADRLLMHLVALSLPRADDARDWAKLLHSALAVATPENNARAINDLCFAIEREGAEVASAWLLTFVSERTSTIGVGARRSRGTSPAFTPKQSNEPTALLRLLFAGRTPVQQCIGLIRSLVALGARSKLDEVVAYLVAVDSERSQSGVSTLLLFAEQEPLDGYMARVDEAKDLLRSYALAHPTIAWAVVNALGQQGAFTFDDVAREIALAVGDGRGSAVAPEA